MNQKTRISIVSILLESLLIMLFLTSSGFVFSENIDGLVAVVNKEAITLTDLRIVKEFDLYELTHESSEESLYSSVLENMINQKLVQQFTGSNINISKKEIDRFLEDLGEGYKDSGWEEKLSAFGMTLADLREYCAQYLSYKTIISERFSRSVVVSLKDIEEYYHTVYVPQQEDQGAEVEPMVDILPKIESAVKERMTKAQAEEWMESLKSQAEIRIYLYKYMDFLVSDEREGGN